MERDDNFNPTVGEHGSTAFEDDRWDSIRNVSLPVVKARPGRV